MIENGQFGGPGMKNEDIVWCEERTTEPASLYSYPASPVSRNASSDQGPGEIITGHANSLSASMSESPKTYSHFRSYPSILLVWIQCSRPHCSGPHGLNRNFPMVTKPLHHNLTTLTGFAIFYESFIARCLLGLSAKNALSSGKIRVFVLTVPAINVDSWPSPLYEKIVVRVPVIGILTGYACSAPAQSPRIAWYRKICFIEGGIVWCWTCCVPLQMASHPNTLPAITY